MTTRALLQLKKPVTLPGPGEAPLEWLVTNGLGGYASGAVAGPPLRRFHGLLIAAHPAPIGRVMLLHALDEILEFEGSDPVAVRMANRGAVRQAPLVEFTLQAGLPVWVFEVHDTLHVEQSVLMPHDQNTVHLRYRLVGDAPAARLRVRPWLDFRPHEGRLSSEQLHTYAATVASPTRFEFARTDTPLVLRMRLSSSGASFVPDPLNANHLIYAIESDRGYEAEGSMHGPGVFTVPFEPGQDLYVSASSDAWPAFEAVPPETAWDLELARRERLLTTSDPELQLPNTFLLPLAADQFVVRPVTRIQDEAQARAAGAEPRTIIAGYPWFTDWGRDTMIGLEGLTLSTGRHHEARDILRTFALHVRGGLIPNLFPEGEREGLYHTADATLWFFHALDRYDTMSGDATLVTELLPVLEDIVHAHMIGTPFDIRVDQDGLITQGVTDLPLTWMDARLEDWVVTPRRGKPVEINALWHNALMLLESWMVRTGRGMSTSDIGRAARQCREAFNARFWDEEHQRLYDVVDGEAGNDAACRPNQVLAIAVTHPPLDRKRWAPVLESVATELLTPMGLRTLSPRHPDYKRTYFGELRVRDAAYHQGTVWPWLIGPFIDAWLAVHPDDAEGAQTLLKPLLQHITVGGAVGSVSEIFDAEPPYHPRGCFAQAWSVGELARVLVKLAVRRRQLQETAAG